MNVPSWVSWVGLSEHVAIGSLVTLALGLLHAPSGALLLAALIVGGVHEQAQRDAQGRTWSDFRWSNPGGPWNGVLDVLAFLPIPLLYWLIT